MVVGCDLHLSCRIISYLNVVWERVRLHKSFVLLWAW